MFPTISPVKLGAQRTKVSYFRGLKQWVQWFTGKVNSFREHTRHGLKTGDDRARKCNPLSELQRTKNNTIRIIHAFDKEYGQANSSDHSGSKESKQNNWRSNFLHPPTTDIIKTNNYILLKAEFQ